MSEVLDISAFTAPKSDQLNSDDLLGATKTIKIMRVAASGTQDQPIEISYAGDGGKPWKPCKSMLRVLKYVWSNNGHSWVGKRLTLYRDPDVLWGGVKVGGIRISHMSDIDKEITIALSESKTKRRPVTIKPLAAESSDDKAADIKKLANEIARALKGAATADDAAAAWKERSSDIETVKASSVKAFESLEQIVKSKQTVVDDDVPL